MSSEHIEAITAMKSSQKHRHWEWRPCRPLRMNTAELASSPLWGWWQPPRGPQKFPAMLLFYLLFLCSSDEAVECVLVVLRGRNHRFTLTVCHKAGRRWELWSVLKDPPLLIPFRPPRIWTTTKYQVIRHRSFTESYACLKSVTNHGFGILWNL